MGMSNKPNRLKNKKCRYCNFCYKWKLETAFVCCKVPAFNKYCKRCFRKMLRRLDAWQDSPEGIEFHVRKHYHCHNEIKGENK